MSRTSPLRLARNIGILLTVAGVGLLAGIVAHFISWRQGILDAGGQADAYAFTSGWELLFDYAKTTAGGVMLAIDAVLLLVGLAMFRIGLFAGWFRGGPRT